MQSDPLNLRRPHCVPQLPQRLPARPPAGSRVGRNGWRRSFGRLAEDSGQRSEAGRAPPTFRVTARSSLEPLQTLGKKQSLSLTVLLARACAAATSAHPLLNSAYMTHGFAHRTRIYIGVAVDAAGSLFAPVLRDVAGRSAAELASD
ncbi:hypothetical protein CO675_22195 [Bradyrhizobium sp. C9]|nr:hypothetical protein CO675_22195 [Bradyrhizobium sp. C9]